MVCLPRMWLLCLNSFFSRFPSGVYVWRPRGSHVWHLLSFYVVVVRCVGFERIVASHPKPSFPASHHRTPHMCMYLSSPGTLGPQTTLEVRIKHGYENLYREQNINNNIDNKANNSDDEL